MQATVREDLRFYWNYRVCELPKGEIVSGDLAAYLLKGGAVVDPMDDEARALLEPSAEAPEQEPEAPVGPPAELDIDGTAADVLAWVGDDPERARMALEQEQAKDKPRSTLVKQLEKLAGSGE
jgi:hypothetical protein